MFIRFAEKTGEIEIRGTRAEFIQLAQVLPASNSAIIDCQCGTETSVQPYSRFLRKLQTLPRKEGPVVISVNEDVLSLAGGTAAMALLSMNVNGFSVDGVAGNHWHLEYFTGHLYLGESTLPIVLALASDELG